MTQQDKATSSISPCLVYADAQRAIEWLCDAFGFEKKLVVSGPGGAVAHSELLYAGCVLMISSPKPGQRFVNPRTGSSQSLCVRVADPDLHCARARAAGAVITREPKDEDYGSRGYMAEDLEGHSWYFGTYLPGEYWSAEGAVEVGHA